MTLETRTHVIDFFTTGLPASMHEKIAESSMAANREPGAIDWEIIPEAPIYDDSMDIDSCLDEWEDIFKENMDPEGKAVTRLQTVISCTFPPSLLSHI
jgi:hypothetical protein